MNFFWKWMVKTCNCIRGFYMSVPHYRCVTIICYFEIIRSLAVTKSGFPLRDVYYTVTHVHKLTHSVLKLSTFQVKILWKIWRLYGLFNSDFFFGGGGGVNVYGDVSNQSKKSASIEFIVIPSFTQFLVINREHTTIVAYYRTYVKGVMDETYSSFWGKIIRIIICG